MPLDEILQRPVLQITPFITREQEDALMHQLPDCASTRWYPAFCDITSRLADKSRGLEAVAEAAGIGIEETMAFGDGGNDVAMLRRAGIGVAMGNANDAVKSQFGVSASHLMKQRLLEDLKNELLFSDNNISQLADDFRFSDPSHLMRFFKQHTGKTLFTVLNEIRIAYACSLLLYSDLNNSQIAYEAGYNNLSYFNKTFKLILHQTPTEYRNNLKLHHDI